MQVTRFENAVIIRSNTRLEQLEKRFNTASQAKFYITQSKKSFFQKNEAVAKSMAPAATQFADFEVYEDEHSRILDSFQKVEHTVERFLKLKTINQSYLTNYIFTEKDVVIVIGQDGLVANAAKYVGGLPIIAINPDPQRYDGVLLPFTPNNFEGALNSVITGNYNYKNVTMAQASLSDGQRLLAFNDFFIGPNTHTSARYRISFNGQTENHSSSGIIISTGAGSTGWLSSLFNMANGMSRIFGVNAPIQKHVIQWDTQELVFVVREPFVSKTSKADISAGIIRPNVELIIESFMPENGMIFSDGVLSDFISFNSGSIARISIAPEQARLVLP